MFKRCGRGGWLCGPACKDHQGAELRVPAWKRNGRPILVNITTDGGRSFKPCRVREVQP